MKGLVLGMAVVVLTACEQKPPPPPISPTPIKVSQAEPDSGTALIAEDPAAKESCSARWQMRELTGGAKNLDKAVFDRECVSRLSAIDAECAKKSGPERFDCQKELSRGVFDQIEEAAKRNDVVLDKFLGTGTGK